jgi:hypothetical protein
LREDCERRILDVEDKMRNQLTADINSMKSYQTGTNDILNKLRIQMETRLNQGGFTLGGTLSGSMNPLSSQ